MKLRSRASAVLASSALALGLLSTPSLAADDAPATGKSVGAQEGAALAYLGTSDLRLTNGIMATEFYGGDAAVNRVVPYYKKTGGSATRIRFGWELVNSNGGGPSHRRMSSAVHRVGADQSASETLNYKNAPRRGKCVRGVILDLNAQASFTGRVVC